MPKAASVARALMLTVAFAGFAKAADLNFSAIPGEEIAANGVLDVGETITIDLSATYVAGEEAVNYQVDLDLTGDVASFTFTPTSPPSFGSPGSATCSLPTAALARCFGNVDLIADPNTRVSGPITVPLGTFVVGATAGPGDVLTVTPATFFTEELVPDGNGGLVGSALPFAPQGLDPNGNVLDVVTGGALDADGDGVLDDGDGSGVVGDNPCLTNSTNAPCDDNCRYRANADQADSGGINNTLADGIGDVCQCGDINDNGIVNLADAGKYNLWLATGGATPNFNTDKCDVGGTPACLSSDVGRINLGIATTPSVIKQTCPAANP